jgi:HlyD family secretion protein
MNFPALARHRWRLLVLFAIALALLGAWAKMSGNWGASPTSEEEQSDLPSEPIPVEAVPVESRDLQPALDLVGTTVAIPERLAVVSPQLGGWIEKVHVVDGQAVHAGDVLATLDSRVAKVDLERAQAALAEKQAVVVRLKRGYLPHELEVARQDRDKARAAMEGLRGELEALQQLRARNEVSRVHLETKVKAAEAAAATQASAEAHVQLLEDGTPPEIIAEAEAQLDSMKANLEHAKLGIEFCSITSPIDGIVVRLLARQGQFFSQASPLATIMDLSEIFVYLRVPGVDFGHVQEGTAVDITPTSLPGKTFSGKITRLNPEADPLTGNIDAFVVVRNENVLLRPGLSCRAHVWLPEISATLSLPTSAIADHAGKAIVTRVREDKAYEVEIVTGVRTTDRVQIVSGLSPGDLVISAGGYGLPEGCPVRVVAPDHGTKTGQLEMRPR